MTQFSVSTQSKLAEIETHLTKHSFLAEGSLPGSADARIFNSLTFVPDRKMYPNFFFWFRLIKQFSLQALKNWEAKDIKPESEKEMEVIQENSYEQVSYNNSPEKAGRFHLTMQIKPKNQEGNLEWLGNEIRQIKSEGVFWDHSQRQVTTNGQKYLEMKCEVILEKMPLAKLMSRVEELEGVESVFQRDPSQLQLEEV